MKALALLLPILAIGCAAAPPPGPMGNIQGSAASRFDSEYNPDYESKLRTAKQALRNRVSECKKHENTIKKINSNSFRINHGGPYRGPATRYIEKRHTSREGFGWGIVNCRNDIVSLLNTIGESEQKLRLKTRGTDLDMVLDELPALNKWAYIKSGVNSYKNP